MFSAFVIILTTSVHGQFFRLIGCGNAQRSHESRKTNAASGRQNLDRFETSRMSREGGRKGPYLSLEMMKTGTVRDIERLLRTRSRIRRGTNIEEDHTDNWASLSFSKTNLSLSFNHTAYLAECTDHKRERLASMCNGATHNFSETNILTETPRCKNPKDTRECLIGGRTRGAHDKEREKKLN